MCMLWVIFALFSILLTAWLEVKCGTAIWEWPAAPIASVASQTKPCGPHLVRPHGAGMRLHYAVSKAHENGKASVLAAVIAACGPC